MVFIDVGCGDGKVTAEIAGYVSHGSVVGVDSSSSMIDLARERYLESKFPNLRFRQMDARELAFHECFDVVFSKSLLEHLRPVFG